MLLTDIKPNPRNPRSITKANLDKLKKSLGEFGKMMVLRPIVIAPDGMILGGNQRYHALMALGYKDIPDDWVKVAGDLTPEEQRRFIVEDNLPFGQWDFDILAADFEFDELLSWGFDEAELLGGGMGADGEDFYTRKIMTPVYTPTGECPSVELLYDDSRSAELIGAINNADFLSDDERAFLTVAAQRHTVLRFDRIAEYYAHADAKVQALMEDSALVIVDVDKAIELGYIKLTESFLGLMGEDYGDD